jgi:hypothetical protein
MAAFDQLPERLRTALNDAPFEISAPSVLDAVLLGVPEDEVLASIGRAVTAALERAG